MGDELYDGFGRIIEELRSILHSLLRTKQLSWLHAACKTQQAG